MVMPWTFSKVLFAILSLSLIGLPVKRLPVSSCGFVFVRWLALCGTVSANLTLSPPVR